MTLINYAYLHGMTDEQIDEVEFLLALHEINLDLADAADEAREAELELAVFEL
jgi:hypothetical protein